jgi:hypothetical protein
VCVVMQCDWGPRMLGHAINKVQREEQIAMTNHVDNKITLNVLDQVFTLFEHAFPFPVLLDLRNGCFPHRLAR